MSDEERQGNEQSWCRAWFDWAHSRKRGKLAQFIIKHLNMRVYASWINVRQGKFEVTDWQTLAKIWYNEKERASEEMDATSIFRKGLTKAFPNLQEVKPLSVKEGTQYKSRVFEATKELLDEVYKFVVNPSSKDYSSFSYGTGFCIEPSVIFTANDHQTQFTPAYNSMTAFQPYSTNHPQNLFAYNTDPTRRGYPIDPSNANNQVIHQQNAYQSAHVLPIQLQPIGFNLQQTPQQNFSQLSHPYHIDSDPVPIASSISAHTDPDLIVPSHHYALETNSSAYSQVDDHSSPPTSNMYSNSYAGYVSPDAYQLEIKASPPDLDMLNDGQSPGVPIGSYESPYNSNINYKMLNSPVSDVGDLDSSYQHQMQEQITPPMFEYLDIRITPNYSHIQGGGDLCIVFLHHNVPIGEKYLYFESLIAPHYTPTQHAGGAIFAKVPPHPKGENVKLHVILAESRTKIASTDFTYIDYNYNSSTYEVLRQLGDSLQHFGPYKSISSDFHQSNVQDNNTYYYNQDYSYSYKLLVMAAGLGLEPLLHTLLQNAPFHQMLLVPSPAGLLPEDYSLKYGHHRISSCLSLLRKNYEKNNGLDNDDSEDNVDTKKGDSKNGDQPRIQANPLDLLDKGGNTPLETSKSIMRKLHELIAPKTTKSTASNTPAATTTTTATTTNYDTTAPTNTSTSTNIGSSTTTITTKPEKIECIKPSHKEEIQRNLSKLHFSHSESDEGSPSSLEMKRYTFVQQKETYARDSGIDSIENASLEGNSIDTDSIQAEITLLQGLKQANKFHIGGITSVNYKKTDKMQDSEAMDFLKKGIDNLRRQESPIMITASSAEMETTIKIEPSKQLHMPVMSDSRGVQLNRNERGTLSYSIIGGNVTGVFVNRVDSSKIPLKPGDQIIAINNMNIQDFSGYEVLMKLRNLSNDTGYSLIVAQNKHRYIKTMSQSENWDSFFVKSNFTNSSTITGGTAVWHVVNSLHTDESWLAWKIGDQGREFKLSEIPNYIKAKQYDRINPDDRNYYTKLRKTKVPKARPVVLLGPMADELKKNLTTHHKDRFSHVDTIGQVALREIFERTSHPVSAAKPQLGFPDPSTYPIYINCKPAPSSRMSNTRSSMTSSGDSDSVRGYSTHEHEITLEGSSVEEFSLKVVDLISREQNTPVWTAC